MRSGRLQSAEGVYRITGQQFGPRSDGKTALVAGASSGIGKELVKIHAAAGGNLVIVARDADKLAALKQELEDQHGAQVLSMAMDLGQASVPREIYAEVQEAGIAADHLINNAGLGGRGRFHERAWEDDLAMIDLISRRLRP